ncbi:MAG: N-6 DNA methylase, partial [Ilumatobacter sp.]
MTDARRLVDKLWSSCNVLRDDGVGTIECTEQLTYLLFLKMAHERATRTMRPEQIVPPEFSWQRLLDADGDELERLIVDLMDKEHWSQAGTDIKGDAYEQLLSGGAEDIKSSAGKYYTPRPLIQAMVDCVQPIADNTVVDPQRVEADRFKALPQVIAREIVEDLTAALA